MKKVIKLALRIMLLSMVLGTNKEKEENQCQDNQ